MSANMISSAKAFVKTFAGERSIDIQLQNSTGPSGTDVKFYTLQNESYSALFAIITMGTGPQALQLINVYGHFDNALFGSSTNIPPEILGGVSVQTNPMLRQFIAYRGDAAGEKYFSNGENSPPVCEKFNYCFMVFGDGSDQFGIKSSTWKAGDADVVSIKISDLQLIDMQTFSDPSSWCKAPVSRLDTIVGLSPETPDARATTEENNNMIIGLVIAAVVIAIIYYIYFMRTSTTGRKLRR